MPPNEGTHADLLTPAQRRVVEDLLAFGRPHPRFDPALAAGLRRRMEEALAPVAEGFGRTLRVGKHDLSNVHSCEAYYQVEKDSFTWAPGNAYGTIAHRALRLSVSMRQEPAPLDLVDMAIDAYLQDDQSGGLGVYLLGASPVEMAELRAEANDRVVQFLECFPPLERAWRPRTDTPIVVKLCRDRITLRGRPDLAFGQARGDEAGVAIIDLKTGRSYPHHFDDLRFYALLQTLKVGIPPWRVASYYLDSATYHHEDVTPATLEVAAGRTVEGIGKIARLLQTVGRADITPGPTCRWCRLRDDCDGPSQLRDRED